MNLAASLVVRNELHRYLAPCIDHLLAFCDTVCVLDDGSDDGTPGCTDGTEGYLNAAENACDRVRVERHERSSFFVHEGRLRQQLLDFTLAHNPTHVVAVDADEFVTDGQALRACIEEDPEQVAWSLQIEEVWQAGEALQVREDGGWRSHPLPCLWRVPEHLDGSWRIMDKRLACHRMPTHVLRLAGRAKPTGASLLHFGWVDEAARAARHARYVRADGGRFHTSHHLASIMWPDEMIALRSREWPAGLRERLQPVAA